MQGLCPTRPLVGVGAVIIRDNEILLVRRGQPPAEGSWSIPGGKVELGETLVDALCREIKEECNLDIEVGPPIAVLDSIVRSSSGQVLYHYALVDFGSTPSAVQRSAHPMPVKCAGYRWQRFRPSKLPGLGAAS